jgi:hypothetical protein
MTMEIRQESTQSGIPRIGSNSRKKNASRLALHEEVTAAIALNRREDPIARQR